MAVTEEQRKRGLDRMIRTRREASERVTRDVLALVDDGLTQAEIARHLGMTRQSVHRIVRRVESPTDASA